MGARGTGAGGGAHPATLPTFRLPDDRLVYCQTVLEAAFLYDEIYLRRRYEQHGVTLDGAAAVIDVGANIGMFSMYAHERAPAATVLSIEPVPRLYDTLTANRTLYEVPGRAVRAAVGATPGEQEIAFYPRMSVLSSASADPAVLRHVVARYLDASHGDDLDSVDAAMLDELLDAQLVSETVTAPRVTLSSLIDVEGMGRVDLLKIDVEGAELEVLAGLEPRHWSNVRQVVLEVHEEESVPLVVEMLVAHGFAAEAERDASLGDVTYWDVYAWRS